MRINRDLSCSDIKMIRQFLHIDYAMAVECKNNEVFHSCHRCGKCGRKFDSNGIMIEDGGTTPMR